MPQFDPWVYKNDSTTQGYPKFGDVGSEILMQRKALVKQYRRIMRRGGRTQDKVIDLYFYVSALRNLDEIAKRAATWLQLPDFETARKGFAKAVPARDIRNVFDHSIEHFQGKGNLQKAAKLPQKLTFAYGWQLIDPKTRKGDWHIDISGIRIEVLSSYKAGKTFADELIDALETAKARGKGV